MKGKQMRREKETDAHGKVERLSASSGPELSLHRGGSKCSLLSGTPARRQDCQSQGNTKPLQTCCSGREATTGSPAQGKKPLIADDT